MEEREADELLDGMEAVDLAGLELGLIGFFEIKLPLPPKRVVEEILLDGLVVDGRFSDAVEGFVYDPLELDLGELADVIGFLGMLVVRVGVLDWVMFLAVLPLRLERVVVGFCVERVVETGVLAVVGRFVLEPDELLLDVDCRDVVDGLV